MYRVLTGKDEHYCGSNRRDVRSRTSSLTWSVVVAEVPSP